MQRLVCAVLLVASLLLGGCGYHLSGSVGAPSPLAGKALAIPIWTNRSYRPNLEAVLTGSLVDEFALRSGGMVVPESAADLLLTGTIVTYDTTAVSYTAADQIREYRVTMTVDATLAERKSQKVLWKGRLAVGQDYPTNANIALQQNSEDAALREVCRKLAAQIFQKMTDNF